MKNKTCGECKYYHAESKRCDLRKIICNIQPTDTGCACFEQKPIPKLTNGDRIRQGGDDALIDFADGIRRRMCHYCTFAKDKSCVDKTGDCWEGVRLWLNAPAESEVKDE